MKLDDIALWMAYLSSCSMDSIKINSREVLGDLRKWFDIVPLSKFSKSKKPSYLKLWDVLVLYQ